MATASLSRVRFASCVQPVPGHTVARDADPFRAATFVLLDPSGAVVHRYSGEQHANNGRDLHNHPEACHTCLHGCDCGPGQAGCGHWGCWQAKGSTRMTCEFATVMTTLLSA